MLRAPDPPRLLFGVVVLLSLLAVASRLEAYVPLTAADGLDPGTLRRWNLDAFPDRILPYRINPQRPAGAAPFGTPGVTAPKLIDTVNAGFTA